MTDKTPRYETNVRVAAVSPLTVTFSDGSTHNALGVVGQSYPVNQLCTALWAQGQMPTVWPVGTTGGTDNVIDGNA